MCEDEFVKILFFNHRDLREHREKYLLLMSALCALRGKL